MGGGRTVRYAVTRIEQLFSRYGRRDGGLCTLPRRETGPVRRHSSLHNAPKRLSSGHRPASFGFRHQLLKGMRNRELAAKAADDNIPLGELIPIAARKEQREASEAITKPAEHWRGNIEQPMVAAVTEYKKTGAKRQAPKEQWSSHQGKSKQCRYCGGHPHSNKKECSALGKTCRECGKQNHFSKVCEAKKRGALATGKVNAVDEAEAGAGAQVRSQSQSSLFT